MPDLETLASTTASENGYELCGLQLLTHLIPMTLQVQIRQASGNDVSLDDCANLSGPMGIAIENSNLLSAPYVLEISSPGIGDTLKSDRDFKSFNGFPVKVVFKNKEGSELQENGLLHECSSSHVNLNIKGRIKQIERNDVIYVRLTTSTD